MDAPHSWPVRVAAAGPVAIGTTLWRCGEQLSVTVIVKATFVLMPDDEMTVTAPEALQVTDEYEGGHPTTSLSAARETVPLLQEAEALLFGQAYAPRAIASRGPGTATEVTVRLAVGRGDTTFIDKSLQVVGDRNGDRAPAPFHRMPIVFERALGGVGFVDNPLGQGRCASADRAPNILSVADPEGTVGCYSPVPPFFRDRRQRLGSFGAEALEADGVDIPPDFDWSYFQAAPPDQRLSTLRGDEWLELGGLTARHEQLRTLLPSARALATVYGHEQANVPSTVPLRADLLIIEPDELRCSVCWRGSFPIATRALAESLVIAGGLELPGRPVLWPANLEEAVVLSAPPARGTPARPDPEADVRTAVYQGRDPGTARGEDAAPSHQPAIKTLVMELEPVEPADDVDRDEDLETAVQREHGPDEDPEADVETKLQKDVPERIDEDADDELETSVQSIKRDR